MGKTTTKLAPATGVPLKELTASWLLALEAENRSPATLRAYRMSVEAFVRWYEKQGGAEPQLDKASVTAFLADLRRAGQKPGTLRVRYAALRVFGRWMRDEGETDYDVLDGLRPPKLDQPNVPHLTGEQMTALIKACKGGPEFVSRRDEAIVRLMTECFMRAAELLALTVDDVDVRRGLAVVRRGKGGKGRVVAFGPDTARAIDRYLRLRRRHPLAETPPMWLPGGGRPHLTYHGLSNAIKKRAAAASITGFTLHQLRHTGAVNWRAAGGSEEGLRTAGGWSDLAMIARYTASAGERLSNEEARRLGLGKF